MNTINIVQYFFSWIPDGAGNFLSWIFLDSPLWGALVAVFLFAACCFIFRSFAKIAFAYIIICFIMLCIMAAVQKSFNITFLQASLQSEEELQDALTAELGNINLLLAPDQPAEPPSYMIVANGTEREVVYLDRATENVTPLLTVNLATDLTSQPDKSGLWPEMAKFIGPRDVSFNSIILLIISVAAITAAGLWLWFWDIIVLKSLSRQWHRIIGLCAGALLTVPIYMMPLTCFAGAGAPRNSVSGEVEKFVSAYSPEKMDEIIARTPTSAIVAEGLFAGKSDFFKTDFLRCNIDIFNYIYYFPNGFPEMDDDNSSIWSNISGNIWLRKYNSQKSLFINRIFTVLYLLTAIASLVVFLYIIHKKLT